MKLIHHLLPPSAPVRLKSCHVDAVRHEFVVSLASIQRGVRCPSCQRIAKRIHSRYERTVSDQPWADWTVRLKLLVRKFFCMNTACERGIFCERVPAIAEHRARSTPRLREQLRHIALCAGASPGARLAHKLDRAVSRNTLLRLVRTAPPKTAPAPRVVGVDDWAIRKGQTYGSILVDLERRQILELLPDREANTLSQWLQSHPGTEIICRDRAGAYGDGASRGEPSAIQVADRFHLIRNLGGMLQRVFDEHRCDMHSTSNSATEPAYVVDPSLGSENQEGLQPMESVVELPERDRPLREHTRL